MSDAAGDPGGHDFRVPAGPPRAYSLTVILLLAAVTFFYQLDRNVIFVTQELIKREYRLSDVSLGSLTGIAYGIANGVVGLPLGWLIDRVVRKRMLGIIVLLWSGMTALCGVATSFSAFFLARIGVGAAEAGGTPLSLSLVSDMVPPARRSSAVGWVSSGYYFGTIVSFLAGGFLAASFGWRVVFLVYGLPGALLGILILCVMPEPARTAAHDPGSVPLRQLVPAILSLLGQPGLRLLYLAVAITTLNAVGVYSWWSSFMVRVHHLDLRTVGIVGTLATGLCGMIGMIGVGFVADRARRRSPGGPLFILSAASLVSGAAAVGALRAPGLVLMTAALCVAGGTATLYIGPGNAMISELAPPRQRGLAFATAVILTNLCGTACGPLLVGALSDGLSTGDDGSSLRIAMTVVSLLQFPVAVIYWRAGRWRVRHADRDDSAAAPQ